MTENAASPVAENKNVVEPKTAEMLAKYEKEIEELKRQLKDQEDNVNIALDTYIEVMSLVPFKLNLSTEKLGRGRTFSFSRFGEVKRILYNDLASVFENYRTFMEQGYFYILNPKVVRKHGLDDIYDKLLRKEMIDKILEFDAKSAIILYQNANEAQKEIIDIMLIDKIKDEKVDDVDFNIIAQISKIGGKDIVKLAKEKKELENLDQEGNVKK